MKEKGKTKSEKVWTSLLFTFSLLLFTSAANVARAATIDITLSNIVQNRTLQSGYIYGVRAGVVRAGQAGDVRGGGETVRRGGVLLHRRNGF